MKSRRIQQNLQVSGEFAVLTYVMGSLFESPAKVLVNTVNTDGAMGKGIAREFKRIYPDMFQQYQDLCEKRLLDIGKLWLYKTPHKWILNFPTKKHWRNPSKLVFIEEGLKKFVSTYSSRGISSVAFPMLGCGNGELDWDHEVRPLMEKYLKNTVCDVYIYLYSRDYFQPEHRIPREVIEWLRSEPSSLPFSEIMYDLEAVLRKDPPTPMGPEGGNVELTIDSEGLSGALLNDNGTLSLVQNWQLKELWQNIRSTGFLTEATLPPSLRSMAGSLIELFGRLPYLKPVVISRTYGNLGSTVGLQLAAPKRDVNPEGEGIYVNSLTETVINEESEG